MIWKCCLKTCLIYATSLLEIKRLELQYAKEKDEKDRQEREREREIERLEREREREIKREKEERERTDKLAREEREYNLKLEAIRNNFTISDESSDTRIDISKYAKLVPVFDEANPDEFFALRKWLLVFDGPKSYALLLYSLL